jgi:hypothetical protein
MLVNLGREIEMRGIPEEEINKWVPLFPLTILHLILLSCRLAMEHLCVLQLETALATLVTTWFTLADRR